MSAKILVVDDELPLQRLITQRFRHQIRNKQFDFIFAYNGREALEKLEADPSIDIVLVDINMPEMDGLTFLEHLKSLDQTIKAVVVSAYEDMKNIRAAMNWGAFDFITKPINFQDLEITINKTLEQVRQIKEKQHKLQQAQNQLLKVNEALRESEQRLQAILDNSPTAVYLKDLQGRYILINQQTERNTRCSREEVIGKTDHEFLPEAIANQFRANDQEVLNTLTALVREEVMLMEDGLHTYISVKFPLLDAKGVVYAVCGISTDITERKKAEEALKKLNEELEERVIERTETLYRREQEFKALVENTPDVITRYDKQLRHLYINPVIEQETGIPSSAFIGKTLSEIGFPEPLVLFWEEHFREVLATGEAKLMEFKFNSPKGLQFYEAQVVPEKAQDGSIASILSIARNITVRKLAEEEIFKALQREKELLELKSSFVAMTSHEFRTPLTTIQSSVELLERYRNQWSQEKQQTHLQRISTSVRRMTQMLDDILIISEAEAGKLKFNPAPMDLVKFCRTLVEDLQQNDNNQHVITLTTGFANAFTLQGALSTPESMPLMDEKLLRQILINLLSNALKYSPAGSTVEFELTRLDGKAVFRIQDKGIGIPHEDQLRLFESFHRAANVGTIQGTGLGLAIVRQCVDLHHGEITVDSVEGIGTTFTVTLPLESSDMSSCSEALV